MLSGLLDCSVLAAENIYADAACLGLQLIDQSLPASATTSLDSLISRFRSVQPVECLTGAPGNAALRMDLNQTMAAMVPSKAVFTRGASRIDGYTKSAPGYFMRYYNEAFSFGSLHFCGV